MSETLYRKHRPQLFKDIIGQEHIKITLENEIENNKVAHAYLFAGPRGIGKTTMARILAKSINCKNKKDKDFEPCNKCSSCLSIMEGNNLDIVEIDAASNRGINEIRELRERVKYSPSNGEYKVFIIDEVHMLTIEAFNALLKTLEEPPKHVIFILATTELHKLPVTIISRCERFDFKVVDIEKLTNHLKNLATKEKVKVNDEILEKIARYSQGYVRDALSNLGQVLSLAENGQVTNDAASLVMPKSDSQLVAELVDNIVDQKFDQAINNLNSLVIEGINLRYFTEELINYLRKIILVKISDTTDKHFFDIEKEVEEKIKSQSKHLDLVVWHGILKEFYDVFEHLDNDGFKQLPLEMAVVSIKNKYFEDQISSNDNIDNNPSSDINLTSSESKKEVSKENKVEKEDTTSIKKEVKKTVLKKGSFALKEVVKVWPQLLINLKDYNHSLSAFVKVGHPLSVSGNDLKLGFKFKFHLDRVLEDQAKRRVEEILEGLINKKVIIQGEIDEDYEKNHEKMSSSIHKEENEDDVMINNLIQNFGGEVVS